MTPKEKATELRDKMYSVKINNTGGWMFRDVAKECAIIAVDLRLDGNFEFTSIDYGEDSLEYWQEVKQEIEKL